MFQLLDVTSAFDYSDDTTCLYLPSWYQTVKVKIYIKPKFSKQIKWDCIKNVLKKNNILPSLGVEWNADYCVIFENEFRLDIF